jgi:hypothetical protein
MNLNLKLELEKDERWRNLHLSANYNEQIARGKDYERFAQKILLERLGFATTSNQSKLTQYTVGETQEGVEFKLDSIFHYSRNLYIEIAEKQKPSNANYSPSGIYRGDNAWLLVIGDYETLYVIRYSKLVVEEKKKLHRRITTPTSQGFLLPTTIATKIATKVIRV